jgi:hypothetical protein
VYGRVEVAVILSTEKDTSATAVKEGKLVE